VSRRQRDHVRRSRACRGVLRDHRPASASARSVVAAKRGGS
jgi:hypothetical protein